MPNTQEDMQTVECNAPGCTHDHSVLWVSPNCHEDAPLEAYYVKQDGVLYIRCADCRRPVTAFLVARRSQAELQ